MSILQLNIGEEDVVRLILEFLHTRELHITQLSLERETGVINGNYSNDVIFLRQLILDGQWDDVLVYIQPLSTLKDFQMDKFNYAILRHKYIELLCIRSEIKAYNNVENIVDEVVKVLSQLEKIAPSKEEYSKLCLLLTLPSITDDAQFKKWNPSNARVQCFREVYPLVEQFLPCDKKPSSSGAALKSAKNDRLMQLMIKGIMYEACVKICQTKARGTDEAQLKEVDFSQMLDRPGFNEKDLSLLSWLESVPNETFTIPFDQRILDVVLEKLVRPSLHTSWTEHILVTPIKPRAYPHLSMPFKRPRSAADAMTRSLRPLPDGAPRHPAVMALSAIDYGPSTSSAAFHLSGAKCSSVMHTSVDRLFHTNDSNVSYHNGQSEKLKPIIDESEKSNETSSIGASNVTTPEHRTQEQYSATPLPKAATPDRSSIADRPAAVAAAHSGDGDFRRELLKQYQQQKQRECDEYLRSLGSSQIIPHQSAEQAGDVQNPYNSPVALRMGHYAAPNIITSTPTRVEEETSGDTIKITPPRPEHVTENTIDETVEFFSPTRRLSCTKDEVVLATSPNLAALKNKSAKKTAVRPVSAVPESDKPTFKPITLLEDVQVVRCAEFHPNGKLYAVGSNTKTLRICAYPKMDDINWDEVKQGPSPPTVLLKRTKHHKGSIYCLAWNPAGDLLASASNDKTVKLMRFNSNACTLEGLEMELSMHDGTVRDLSFIEDSSNKSSLLVSGGAGDCRIYVTDCAIGNTFQSLGGHTGHVLSLYNWGGAMFVSGSQDKTVRLWDLRVGSCVNVITTTPPNLASAVTSLAVEPSGRLLVSGHEDGFCALHDLRSSRPLQRFARHSSDVRSVRFSPGAYYLLTAGYDGLVVLTDVQGDLTSSLPSVLVARHSDKVIAARWHPEDFSFLSTSADKTSVLWSIPPL